MNAELTTAEPSEPTPTQEKASVVLTVHPLADKFPALTAKILGELIY